MIFTPSLVIRKGDCFQVHSLTTGVIPTLPFVSIPIDYLSKPFEETFIVVWCEIEFDDNNPLAAPKVKLHSIDGTIKELQLK